MTHTCCMLTLNLKSSNKVCIIMPKLGETFRTQHQILQKVQEKVHGSYSFQELHKCRPIMLPPATSKVLCRLYCGSKKKSHCHGGMIMSHTINLISVCWHWCKTTVSVYMHVSVTHHIHGATYINSASGYGGQFRWKKPNHEGIQKDTALYRP